MHPIQPIRRGAQGAPGRDRVRELAFLVRSSAASPITTVVGLKNGSRLNFTSQLDRQEVGEARDSSHAPRTGGAGRLRQ